MNNKRDRDDYSTVEPRRILAYLTALRPLGELRLHSLGIVYSLGIGEGKPTMGDGDIGSSSSLLTRASQSVRESGPAKARQGAGAAGHAPRAAGVVATSPRRIQQQLQWTMKDPPPPPRSYHPRRSDRPVVSGPRARGGETQATLRVGGSGGGGGGVLVAEGHEQHQPHEPPDAVALCESLADEVRKLVATNHRIDGSVQALLGTLRGGGDGDGNGVSDSGRSGAARSRHQAATTAAAAAEEGSGGRKHRRRRRQQEEDSEDEEEENEDESLAGTGLFGLRNRRKRPKVGNNDGRPAGFADGGEEKTSEARESVDESLRADNERLRRDLHKERSDKASLERELARVRDENRELKRKAPSREEPSTARGSSEKSTARGGSEKSKLGQQGKTAARSEREVPRNNRRGTGSDGRDLAQKDPEESSYQTGRKRSPRLESSGKRTVRLQQQRSTAPPR
jgi:hypothetical protein